MYTPCQLVWHKQHFYGNLISISWTPAVREIGRGGLPWNLKAPKELKAWNYRSECWLRLTAFTGAGVKFIWAHHALALLLIQCRFRSSKYVLLFNQMCSNSLYFSLMASSLNPSMLAGMQRTSARNCFRCIVFDPPKSYLARPLHDYAPLAVFSTTVALIAPRHHPPFLCGTITNH